MKKNSPAKALLPKPLAMACTVAMFGLFSQSVLAQNAAETDAFPDVAKSYLRVPHFIHPDNVRRVELGTAFKNASQAFDGMHKDQVRLELSHPHFDEGIGFNKVWNYVFNFYTGARTGDANSQLFESCQFRVVFNNQDRVERVEWKNPQCAAFTNPPIVKPLN
jgi:OOP family OmpA-OmpF porin